MHVRHSVSLRSFVEVSVSMLSKFMFMPFIALTAFVVCRFSLRLRQISLFLSHFLLWRTTLQRSLNQLQQQTRPNFRRGNEQQRRCYGRQVKRQATAFADAAAASCLQEHVPPSQIGAFRHRGRRHSSQRSMRQAEMLQQGSSQVDSHQDAERNVVDLLWSV